MRHASGCNAVSKNCGWKPPLCSLLNYVHNNNQDISGWDTSHVTDMSWMFHQAWEFNQPIGSWNTANVKNMNSMFAESSFNQDISNWNTANVTDMNAMFYECDFNQPLGKWNVSKVNDMSEMFYNCNELDQDFSAWDVSKIQVKDMFESTKVKKENYPRGWKEN